MRSSVITLLSSKILTLFLQDVDKWSFDVFALNEASGEHSLKFMIYELFTRYDLINRFKVRNFNCETLRGLVIWIRTAAQNPEPVALDWFSKSQVEGLCSPSDETTTPCTSASTMRPGKFIPTDTPWILPESYQDRNYALKKCNRFPGFFFIFCFQGSNTTQRTNSFLYFWGVVFLFSLR